MPTPDRPIPFRSVVRTGLDAVPWIGLAAGSVFLPSSTLGEIVPAPQVSVPLAILLTGAIVMWARRWIAPAAPPASPPTTPRAAPTSTFDPASRLQQTSQDPSGLSHDTLVGLADRSQLLKNVSESVTKRREDDTAPPALFTIRTNEYRDVTESFGHQAGQDLLTAVANRIAEVPPPTATVARIAEDTFAIFLPQPASERAEDMGKTLKECFETPFKIAGHRIPIEVSIGLATRPSPGSTFETAEKMLQASYSAMHQVQRTEGDNFLVFQNGNQNGTRRLQRRERLRQAIQQDELVLHYQPIIHLVTGETVGAEALVRWDHPDRGLLSPADFIPLAEETGLVGELDRWVFHHALEDAEQWTKGPDSPLDWISVNISPQSVEGDLQAWCLQKLHAASVPDGGLHLEITERWALLDERSLQPLRDEGVQLSIDDFGTGYSSLRYLRSLNADVLKIDSEFIQALGRDEKTTAIVQFLMNLSLRLDVEVIAEGVETEQQADILRDLGCTRAQGYHFSKPVPTHELIERARSVGTDASASNTDGLPTA